MADIKFTSIPTKDLSDTINSGASSFKLGNILSWDQETNLVVGDFSDTGLGIFRSSDNKYIELFTFDPSTIGDASITILNRGLAFTGEDLTTEIEANKRTWIKGDTKVEIGTHSPNALQWLRDYIDGIAIAGSPDSSTTAKGLVEIATQAEIDADTGSGSTSAILSISPDKLATSKYGTRLPTADEKAGLTGLSATNLPVVPDGVTQSAVLQSETTSTNTIEVGEADATTKKNSLGQSFVASKTKMRGFELFKKADTGTFTGSVVITLQATTSGEPSGTPLATATITNANWLLLSAAKFEAIFATEYGSLVIGNTYWIDVQPSTSDNSNHPNLGADTSGGDGTVYYNNVTDGWVQITSSFLYYKTLEGNVNQVVKTTSEGRIDPILHSNGYIFDFDNTAVSNDAESNVLMYEYPTLLPRTAFSEDSTLKITLFMYENGNGDDQLAYEVRLNGSAIANDKIPLGSDRYVTSTIYIKNDGSTNSQSVFIINNQHAHEVGSDGGGLDLVTQTKTVETADGGVLQIWMTDDASTQSVSYLGSIVEIINN